MKKFVFKVVLTIFFVMSSSQGFSAIQIKLVPKTNPPQSGENELEMTLTDAQGKAVDNAQVQMIVFMPAMGTMPRMDEKVQIEPKKGGKYAAKFDLSMGGTWEITATIKSGKDQVTKHFTLTTGISGISTKGSENNVKKPEAADSMDVGMQRLQKIGVRFAEVTQTSQSRRVEAVGVVEQDQTHREEVSLRYSGYIVKLFRGRVGDPVKAGDPLFTVYSPDLVTAQAEFLLAEKITEGGPSLHEAASTRLKNLGLTANDIEQIRRTRKTQRDITIRSPISGTILEVSTLEGASVAAGQLLFVIGDLSKTSVVARVFQQDVKDIKVGLAAEINLPGSGADPLPARVSLIYPQVEQGAGTVNVRLDLNGIKAGLKPGIYVDVAILVDLGEQLTIPSDAVLYSGRHQYVFVDQSEGQLEPREVSVGKSVSGRVAVLSGLSAGERVAASGTFLLGSEAQLRSALPKWKSDIKKPGSNDSKMPQHVHGEGRE